MDKHNRVYKAEKRDKSSVTWERSKSETGKKKKEKLAMSDTSADPRLSFTLGQEKNTIAYRKRKKSPNTSSIFLRRL